MTLPCRVRQQREQRRDGSARDGGSDCSRVRRRRLLYLIRFEHV